MKGLIKLLAGLFTAAVCMASFNIDVSAGTGIYVGKDASAEGTTLIGVSVEGNVGESCVPVIIEKGVLKEGDTIDSSNGFSYTLPEDSARVVLERMMTYTDYGDWNCCASNEYGVSVAAIITTGASIDAQLADPFVSEGVSEEKLAQILASTSKSAKEAAELLCSLIDENGAESAEIVLIADPEEAWAVENFTGHQYVAKKLPADCIATFGSEPIFANADPDDADTICSEGLFSLPEENGFAVYEGDDTLDLILTYNEENDYSKEDHLRGWVGHDLFAPSEELAYDAAKGYDVFFVPDEAVSIAEAFDFFRNRFEGTDYDLSDEENMTSYMGINNQFVSSADIIQVFDGVPAEMSTVIWTTPANPTASPFVPVPVITGQIPESYGTDVTEDAYADGILQFEFAKLNNTVIQRREAYGRSIREYWEGMEALSAADVANLMTGAWKDDFEASPEKAAEEASSYVESIVSGAGENCDRLSDELEWYLFKNGIVMESVPDEQLAPFECSFDAIAYANMSGWDATVEDNLFTAEKDGKKIEVVLDGDDKGTVTFTGFDAEKLVEDFMAGKAPEFDDVAETEEEPEEVEETAETDEAAKEPEAEDSEAESEDTEAAEEVSEEQADEEVVKAAAEKLEVDTIAELGNYFAEKISSVPRDGWSENEIAREINDISIGVVDIINRNFNMDPNELITMDTAQLEKKGNEVASNIISDPALNELGEKMVLAGMDLTGLTEKYFASLYEDVSADVVSGRINQQGVEKILMEAEANIEGIARIYLEGLEGAFSEVFDTELTEEDITELLTDIGDAAEVLDEYGVIDLDSLGLKGLELEDLTEADINVVLTLNGLDEDVINGLSDLLGVDVRTMLDGYMDMINSSNSNIKIVEENHETPAADSAPDEEVMTLIELEEELSEDDIVIPQEVIDLLNEAIYGTANPDEATIAAVEAEVDAASAEENVTADATDAAPADAPIADDTSADDAFSVSIGGVLQNGEQVLLPIYMLKYFS
ncbi:MAG: C69 family dipeptidase [Lachnospiraceae bacterium]|nr:C69 family dipeptidase [Lachnospiraceae bacterium]